MSKIVINYFRDNLRKKLKRPMCGRFLPLWDDSHWITRKTDVDIDYIKANDFLIFLYHTKKDTCCMEVTTAQLLSNAIDKFFFLLFDFQAYFNVFTMNGVYKDRVEIINDIIKYKQSNFIPSKFFNQYKYLELFIDLIKKMDEWEFWKRQVIINFTKIVITPNGYKFAEKYQVDYLRSLLYYIEQLFNKEINK